MLYPHVIVEALVGLAGGEPDKTGALEMKKTFEEAESLVEEWKNPGARWMAEMANHFGAITMQSPDCSNRLEDKGTCYRRESESKQKRGRRPIFNYREDNMCEACRAHWHFNMASLLLHSIASKEAHCESIKKRESA
jgi:hypothetical protein